MKKLLCFWRILFASQATSEKSKNDPRSFSIFHADFRMRKSPAINNWCEWFSFKQTVALMLSMWEVPRRAKPSGSGTEDRQFDKDRGRCFSYSGHLMDGFQVLLIAHSERTKRAHTGPVSVCGPSHSVWFLVATWSKLHKKSHPAQDPNCKHTAPGWQKNVFSAGVCASRSTSKNEGRRPHPGIC